MKARVVFIVICLIASILTVGPGWAGQESDPAAPVIHYHFKVLGEFSGGEDLWVNNVHLGKLPFTMTLDELKAKVPILDEPPEGYADETMRGLNGHWLQLQLHDFGLEKDGVHGSSHGIQDRMYYAKVKLGNEWGSQGSFDLGGGGGAYRQDYNVSIRAEFPQRKTRIKAKADRFQTLLSIARLHDYQVEPAWYETLDTYEDKGWRDLYYKPSLGEPNIQKLLDGWACWRFQIGDPNDTQGARAAFKRVCEFVNTQQTYRFTGIEGRAIELIHDKLDLDTLIRQYKRALVSGKALGGQITVHETKDGISTVISTYHEGSDVVRAETSAIFHALRCWDAKLDKENYHSDNPVELEVVPDLVLYHSEGHVWFEQAVQLGGPVMARFLVRQKQRSEARPDDNDNLFGGATHGLNRWCVYLAEMDDPAGRKFRQQHRALVMDMADKICEGTAFRMDHTPPNLLFMDNDLGKQSLAWRYWDRFSSIVETSRPLWSHYMLAKRFRYLGKMEGMASLDMYLEAWHETHREVRPSGTLYNSVDTAHRWIPKDKREAFEKLLLAHYQTKLQGLGNRGSQNRTEYDNISSALGKLERYVSTRNALDLLEKQIMPFPTRENRALLEKLLNDPDPKIRQAAQKTSAHLDQLKTLPLENLIAYPAGKGAQ